jgi:hypothetical protein
MGRVPDDHELAAFFEAEPRVLDPDVPWVYNTLDFETERHGILVRCRLVPSYGDVDVRLVLVGGVELVRVKVTAFYNVRLIAKPQGEVLVATSDQEPHMLCLMLKPRVWLGLGNFENVPPD